MAALDDLYGPGADAGFRSALAISPTFGTATFVESAQPNGSVVVECRWAGGSMMRIRFEPTNMHYIGIEAASAGFYTALVNTTTVPAWARSVGVLTFTANARDLTSLGILKSRGSWKELDPDRNIVWTL